MMRRRATYVILADGRRVKPWVRSLPAMSATQAVRHRRARMEKLLGPGKRSQGETGETR